MNSILWHFLRIPALAVMLVLCLSLHVKAELVKGAVKTVQGDVTLVLPDGTSGPLTLTSQIPSGSRITCGDNGTAAIYWMDGARGIICPKTIVEVDSLNLTKENGKFLRRVALNLSMGTIYCQLVHDDGRGSFDVQTPKGTIVDKGTIWKIVLGPDDIRVSVLEGFVDLLVKTCDVKVDAGQTLYATDRQLRDLCAQHPDLLSDVAITDFRAFWILYFPLPQFPNSGNDYDGIPVGTVTGGGGTSLNIPLAEKPGNFVSPTPTNPPVVPPPIPTPPPVTP